MLFSFRKTALLLTLSVFGSASLALANSCPDLRGTFSCPEHAGQPAYTLIVKQKTNAEDETLYKHYYSFFGAWLPTLASDAGANNPGGWIAQCVSYLGFESFVFYPAGGDPATEGTYNFINADGDYQADFNGETAIVCTRD